MRRDHWINFKDVGVIGELYFLTVLRMIHHNTWKLNQNLKNEDETEILLVHIFYWMQTNYLQEICKNIFVFLWGPASNKMKMKKKKRIKHKFIKYVHKFYWMQSKSQEIYKRIFAFLLAN